MWRPGSSEGWSNNNLDWMISSLYSIMSNQEKTSICLSQSGRKVVPCSPPVYSWWWWWQDWGWGEVRQSFDWQVPRLAGSQPGLTFNSFIKRNAAPARPDLFMMVNIFSHGVCPLPPGPCTLARHSYTWSAYVAYVVLKELMGLDQAQTDQGWYSAVK